MNRGRYFGGAAGLGSVADDSAHISERVGDGSADLLVGSARHVRDAGAGSAGCAHGAAESRKRTDIVFNINGNEVGDQQGAVHLLFRQVPALRIGDHRQCDGDSLVAAAGIDNDRHGTSAHTGIGSCGRPRTGAALDVVSPVFQYSLADSCAPGIVQALLGDCGVESHLPLQRLLHVGNIHLAGIFDDRAQVHFAAVALGTVIFLCRCISLRNENSLSVLLDLRNIRVVLLDRDRRLVVLVPELRLDVEIGHVFRQRHVTDPGLHQFPGLCAGFVVRIRDDFQHLVRISAHYAEHGRCLNSLLTAGIGHRHALHIFDDVAGTCDADVLRHLSKLPVSFCCSIRDSDRFRTPHGRDKLFL